MFLLAISEAKLVISSFNKRASDIFSGKVLKASIIRPRSLGFFPYAFAKAKVNNIKATNWVVKHLVEATPIS